MQIHMQIRTLFSTWFPHTLRESEVLDSAVREQIDITRFVIGWRDFLTNEEASYIAAHSLQIRGKC